MRKSFFIFTLIILCVLSSCGNAKKTEEYCYKINSLLKDMDFATASVQDSKILLFDAQDEPLSEVAFEDYTEQIPILCVRKEKNVVFFVTGGSVDDEEGILFMNDNSDSFLDGIHSITRIGGNSYKYSTAG